MLQMLNICHPSGLAEGLACENRKAIQAMFRIVAAALILLVSAWSPARADAKPVALGIGMSDYQHLSKLPNPVPDAKAIAAEFKSHGFEVSEYNNLDRAGLLDALEKFERDATGADVAPVYYAGHGMSFQGKNLIDARGEFRQEPR